MSNMLRKIKRGMRMKDERTTCPKCHAKLIEKYGYGMVCEECGWWRKEKHHAE